MKKSVVIFLVGLALGIAGSLAIRPAASSTDGGSTHADPHANPAKASLRDLDSADRLGPGHRGQRRIHAGGVPVSSGDARTDLVSFLDLISNVDDGSEINIMLLIRKAAVLTSLNEGEAIDLLGMLAQQDETGGMRMIDDEMRGIASVMVFSRLCELNGPQAMQMVADGVFEEIWEFEQEEMLAMGMNSWIASDPDSAQQWFEARLNEADKLIVEQGDDIELEGPLALLEEDAFRMAYLSGMAKHDPESLKRMADRITDDEARASIQEEVMTSLVMNEESSEGLQSLLKHSEKFPDVRLEAMEKLSLKDPQAAKNWIESQPPSAERDREISEVAGVLLEQQGQAGIDWFMAQSMDSENSQSLRMVKVASHLMREEPGDAAKWIEHQPDTSTRDAAEASLALNYSSQSQWDNSMTWVTSVKDQEIQKTTLKSIFWDGWDTAQEALPAELIEAADSAGFGDQAREYRPD